MGIGADTFMLAPECAADFRAIDHVADPTRSLKEPSCRCHEYLSDCDEYLENGPKVVDPAGLVWHIVAPCTVHDAPRQA